MAVEESLRKGVGLAGERLECIQEKIETAGVVTSTTRVTATRVLREGRDLKKAAASCRNAERKFKWEKARAKILYQVQMEMLPKARVRRRLPLKSYAQTVHKMRTGTYGKQS